ncbi:MAG TPA: tetraacyldisaccharide 4'-kinase [Candidatus Angelobacter sp.]|nr:tetraacyldisaccharide 4'-kinase [Candidatus Angelobacter sp.]
MNPLSTLFGAGVAIRNMLYDRGALRVQRLSRPVVSIGNISVGGSGKTPFVIALGELLKQRGIQFDVLSRGYGRTSTQIAAVDLNGKPEDFGDEPLLIAHKLQVPVIVGADRYQAGLFAEKTLSSQLHLLDDGFQHRQLRRDFDIVLLPQGDLADALLPVGRLREPPSSLRRADAIVTFSTLELGDAAGTVWPARRSITLPAITGKAVAFCGIGRSRQFFDSVRALKPDIADELAFGDHHRYRQSDVDRLLRLKRTAGAASFITTAKDLINLGGLSEQLQPLQTAELKIDLAAPGQALAHLLNTLEQRCGCRL